ncbi:pre-RNA processing PIH1/Nop17-domain-containing protein [Pavlovales sp. CCMP2436]|nr:pre-RNA processing PIH1/Nop17-domain-containing protein [Pavlovales sp. CCMP2436]
MPAPASYAKWDKLEVSDDEDDIRAKKAAKVKEDMTPKEQSRIAECLQQPEFNRLLAEYNDEISDPANREETEVYLQQVEREAREGRDPSVPGVPSSAPPPGQHLIKPEPGFVVKTWLKEGTQKVMLNVVQHADLAPATSTRVHGRESWHLPYIMSPALKVEKDKAGADVHVYDACFSPNVLERAKVSAAWKNMVASTVHEGVQKLHKIELGADWKLPKLTYFGNFGHGPSVMTHNKTAHDKQAADAAVEPAAEPTPPKPAAGPERRASAPKPAPSAAPAPKSAPAPEAATPAAKPVDKPAAKATPAVKSAEPVVPAPPSPADGRARPESRFVYTTVPDLRDSFGDTRIASRSSRPQLLTLVISLPAIESVKDIDLEVDRERVVLSDTRGIYFLAQKFPYPVDSDRANAKWDKAKRELAIKMPVLPDETPAQPNQFEDAAAKLAEAEASRKEEEEAAVAAAGSAAATAMRQALEEDDARRAVALRTADARRAAMATLDDMPPSAPPPAPSEATPTPTPASTPSKATPAPTATPSVVPAKAVAPPPKAPAPVSVPPVSVPPVSEPPKMGEDLSPDAGCEAEPAQAVREAEGKAMGEAGRELAYDWRQNEQNLTMVVDVEGAFADSVELDVQPLELRLRFNSAEGAHQLSVQLAHAVDPKESRAEVNSECILVILRKMQLGVWDGFESKDLAHSFRQAPSSAPPRAAPGKSVAKGAAAKASAKAPVLKKPPVEKAPPVLLEQNEATLPPATTVKSEQAAAELLPAPKSAAPASPAAAQVGAPGDAKQPHKPKLVARPAAALLFELD